MTSQRTPKQHVENGVLCDVFDDVMILLPIAHRLGLRINQSRFMLTTAVFGLQTQVLEARALVPYFRVLKANNGLLFENWQQLF